MRWRKVKQDTRDEHTAVVLLGVMWGSLIEKVTLSNGSEMGK